MQVVVKKSVLEEFLKMIAEDRSFHSARIDQIAGEGKPVLPDAQVASQLSTDSLPVENPDFLPVNAKQLSGAASQISKQVPPDKIQKFYKGMKRLLRKTGEPKQYKGMSETDLMESLRPLVLREAKKLGMFLPGGDEDEEEAETGFRPGPTSDIPERPPKRSSVAAKKASKVAGKIARAKADSAPIVSIGGKKLDSQTVSELEFMRQRWTAAPDMIAMRQIRDQEKISLADIVIGDANRVLDVFLKAGLGAPSTLEQAQIAITVESLPERVPAGFSLPTAVRKVVFQDLAGREELKGKLFPIVHTGGPIEVYTIDENGKEVDQIYYILRNFPFNEQEYIAEFEAALKKAREAMHDEALAALTKKQRSEEERNLEKETDLDKKKRAATMQKSLSVGLAQTDAVSMREENPKKLEKLLQGINPSMTLADFDNLSDDEKDEVLEKVVVALDKERGPYYAVGEMDYLRDIFSDESDEKYTVSDKITSSDPVALGVEKLAKEFFESVIRPSMTDVVDTMLENNPDISVGLDDVIELFACDSYDSFIESVDDKNAFIEFLTGVTKDILKENPDLFDSVMPEFGKIRNAVENKDEKTLAGFEGRFRLLGIEDVGRLRSIFQYLKSPVAFMKAIDVTVRLSEMSGKTDFADQISDPQALQRIVSKQISQEINKDPTSFFLSYKSLLTSKGINSPVALSSADPERVISIVSPVMATKLKNSLSKKIKQGSGGDIDVKVENAIDEFITIIGPDFIDMSDTTDPASKPVLNYIKKFVTDMQSAAEGDPVFDSLAPKISATVDSMLKPKAKAGAKKK